MAHTLAAALNQEDAWLPHYERYVRCLEAIAGVARAPVGATPKDLVWELNKTRLYRYRLPQPRRHATPLLLVYALINKPFIFDLLPGRSFVEYLLGQGFEVYLLDWGTPGSEDSGTTFTDYVTEYLRRAVRRVLRVSGASAISLLGYCVGGTLRPHMPRSIPKHRCAIWSCWRPPWIFRTPPTAT